MESNKYPTAHVLSQKTKYCRTHDICDTYDHYRVLERGGAGGTVHIYS